MMITLMMTGLKVRKKMKIDLYITYYELSHLQSFIPINSKIFWVFDEILSMIEEEIDKGAMKNGN